MCTAAAASDELNGGCTDLALEIEKEFDLCFPQVESTYFYFPRLERNATRKLPSLTQGPDTALLSRRGT